jgi:hypothetical protein
MLKDHPNSQPGAFSFESFFLVLEE